MQMTVVSGLFLANVVDMVVENREHGWRATNGAAPIVVMLGICFVPERPYLYKDKEEAKGVLNRLRLTDNVIRELQVIDDQVEEELTRRSA
ncbi:hypothetical protein V7S43_015771 [Phytophthora oleae]|uniref:Uncharacterized protein n=1 Tax=Phytophthora oleae TaxID=2107226 RepID=A0ABD3EXI8_9STRA